MNIYIIKLALVDDLKFSRDATKLLFRNDHDIVVEFDSDSGKELFKKLEKFHIDQILMDVRMPVMDGVETTLLVKKDFPAIKVIAYSVYCDPYTKIKMAEAGISSFLGKDAGIMDIRKTILEVDKNGVSFNDDFPKILFDNMYKPDNKGIFQIGKDLFSIEEIKLINVLCDGKKSNLEMAKKLHFDIRTFERHKHDIFIKTKTGDIQNLVKFAIQHQIIPLYTIK
jgi:DNA-binding NarL/FixJ family response regulator